MAEVSRPVPAQREVRPLQQEKAQDPGATLDSTLSTDVQLKISSLHKMAEQAQRERKNALVRRAASRATRAPLPSVRLSVPGAGISTPPDRIVMASLQSYPGQRTASYTQKVINQYAVASNPRYAPRAQGPREAGHLFVFDVMNSLNTTMGRAFSAGQPGRFRPGTQAETWKWLKEAALVCGWRVVEGSALLEAAARGLPIIAMAETRSGPRFAVVEPGPPGPDGKPRLASAHEPRGSRQPPEQVFGSSKVRYLAHD